MKKWKEMKLGDLITLQRGRDLPKSKMINGNIPVAGSNGIIGYHNIATTKGIGITIGRSGNLGNAYLYKEDFWAHNTTLYVKNFKGNNEIYVYYFLKNIDFKSFNVGSAVPTLNRNHIHPMDIKIPPLLEQKAIAEVLSSLDDKIDLLHRQNQTLEQMAATLFRQWFVEEADDSWEEGTLGDVCEIIGGFAFKSKDFVPEGVPVIKIKNITNNSVEILNNQFVSLHIASTIDKKYKLKDGDIVMAMTGATIGKIGLISTLDYNSLLLNQRVAVLRSSLQPLLWFLLNSINLEAAILNLSNGAAQANISASGISYISIPKMNEDKIKEFNSIIEPNFDKILKNTKQIRTLEKLRDTLLPKLISGEVRVSI